jgi:hypothetical protein
MFHHRARLRTIRSAAVRFLTTPAAPLPLGVLRIGLGLLLVVQALAVAPRLSELYGALGLVQGPVVDALVRPWTPRVSWLASAIAPFGLDESAAIRIVFIAHLLGSLALIVGWHTRIAACCVCLTNLTLMTTSSPHTYGVDMFLKITLFYGMFAPLGAALSWDVATGRTSSTPSFAARMSLRVLQAHLVLVYVASGIEKASGRQWWDGEALWRSWMRSDLGMLDFSWVAWCPAIAMVGCWATLVLEIGYGVFIWPRRTRVWWAWSVIVLHAGIGLTLGLWAFACIMMLLTFCAWIVPCEPVREPESRELPVQSAVRHA